MKNKLTGTVYTPHSIAEYMINEISPKINDTIFEPSVGEGIFIITLLKYIQKKYNLKIGDLKQYFNNNVYMQDINENSIFETLKNINTEFNTEFKLNNDKVIIGDTLKKTFKENFDIIIGNPPYIRNRLLNINTRNYIKKNYKTCIKGNFDIYFAFTELAMKKSKKFIFIVPNTYIYTNAAANLRKELIKKNISIIDFKNKKIFQNVNVYTSILKIDEKQNQNILYKNNFDEKWITINKNTLNNDEWIFKKFNYPKNIKIIKIHTEIATLNNKIYINPPFKNKDTINLYKISKIKSLNDLNKHKHLIIFPYKLENGKYVLKEENELEIETYNYFKKNKKELLKRDNGKAKFYKKFYQYGRSQGFNIFKNENNIYYIIIPGIIEENFNFFSLSKNDLDFYFLFLSGYIIEVEKKYVDKILNFLNSKKFNFILKESGKSWSGSNKNYYSLTIKQLKNIFNIK